MLEWSSTSPLAFEHEWVAKVPAHCLNAGTVQHLTEVRHGHTVLAEVDLSGGWVEGWEGVGGGGGKGGAGGCCSRGRERTVQESRVGSRPGAGAGGQARGM